MEHFVVIAVMSALCMLISMFAKGVHTDTAHRWHSAVKLQQQPEQKS
jgi:hypothetical protein